MKEGDKVRRAKKGKPIGHDKDDEPTGPTCTVTRIYSWKLMKIAQDENGDVDYVRTDEYEEE